MSDKQSITQIPDPQQIRQILFRSWTERYIATGRKPPKEYIQLLQDENKPVECRCTERIRYTLSHAVVEFQGELIKARTSGIIDRPLDQGSHARQPIKEFTLKARKNMLETVSRMDWNKGKAVFITLTYHHIKPNAKDCKRDLRTFLKRLYRKYGNKAVLWRIERQKRGAWHFHLIVFNLPFFPIETLLLWWQEITRQPTITQCDIQLIDNAKKARSYVAKYCGKADIGTLDYLTNLPGYSLPGRFWGIENRALINWAELIVMVIDIKDTLQKFKDVARGHWSGVNDYPWAGFSIFVDDLDFWQGILWYLFAGISPA
jgi:hypothetical protein